MEKDHREEILSRYPKVQQLTLTLFKKLIWDVDATLFGGEVKRAKNRKFSMGYHADVPNTIFPYKISFTQGRHDAFLHINVPGSPKQIRFYTDLYRLKDSSIMQIALCIAEDILIEIAFIAYGFHKIRGYGDNIYIDSNDVLLNCVRMRLFGRSPNDEVLKTAEKNVEKKKYYDDLKKTMRAGVCPPDDVYMAMFEDLQMTHEFIRDLINRRACLEVLAYIKDNSRLIPETIYTMEKFTCDDYVFLRGIYTEEELIELTYAYLNIHAKKHKMGIEDVKTKMGFIDECYI
jgi:hypothetical protein